jgi:hypothetical protein
VGTATMHAVVGVLTSTDSGTLTVAAGSESKLAFTAQPSNVAIASSITPAVQVSVEDAAGNVVTTATDTITVAIGTNPGTGTLSGTLGVNALAGVATFSTLNINNVGTGYTLTAAASGFTTVISSTFNVTAACTSSCQISGQVTGPWVRFVSVALSGGPSTPSPVLTDANGNYSFTGLMAGTYTITPTLAGYIYNPVAPQDAVNGNTVQNFTATSAVNSFSISGTVSYPTGSHTGTTLINVFPGNCTGCNAIAGTTLVTAPTPGGLLYTIRGLPSGTYSVNAEIDTQGTGIYNASNPEGSYAGNGEIVTITSSNAIGINFSVADRTAPAAQPPSLSGVFPSSGTAFIVYGPQNNSSEEVATSYKLYYGTDVNATNLGSVSIPAGNQQGVFILPGLTNGTAYYFKMSAVNSSGESALTSIVGPVTIGNSTAGANSVSGTITSNATPTGPLYVGLFSGTLGVYYQRIASPSTSQAYTISGVPNGDYQLFVVLDQNSNGYIDAGDITNFVGANGPLPITVSATTSGNNIALTSAAATTYVATNHTLSSGVNTYNLNVGLNIGTKLPVSATLFSGKNVAVPFDIDSSSGNNSYSPVYNNSISPTVGDVYQFLITYSDGSTSVVSTTVSAVLTSFAQNLAMNSPVAGTTTVPVLNWAAPASPPSVYNYRVGLSGNNVNWDYKGSKDGNGLPSTTTHVTYNVDGRANPNSPLTSGTYTWWVTVQDANSNTAQFQTTYTVP